MAFFYKDIQWGQYLGSPLSMVECDEDVIFQCKGVVILMVISVRTYMLKSVEN